MGEYGMIRSVIEAYVRFRGLNLNIRSYGEGMTNDLRHQMQFLTELERLKTVYRQNGVIDHSRSENSAEHSWHVALMALVLQEHAQVKDLDILKVVKMLLIHDVVEIDTGDTFLYDDERRDAIADDEAQAAGRIFGLLSTAQRQEFLALWHEFEERHTPEAQYAAAMDGLQPLLNHVLTATPHENPHQMTKSAVIQKKQHIQEASPQLWDVALDIIEKSTDQGLYSDDVGNSS